MVANIYWFSYSWTIISADLYETIEICFSQLKDFNIPKRFLLNIFMTE